jgi:hypothetical protein
MAEDLRELGHAVERQVQPPRFADLQSRSRRRVARRRGAGVALAAAAAVAVVAGVQLSDGDARTAPPPPATAPTDGPTEDGPHTSEEVVTHPDADLSQLAVDPEDTDVMASAWRWCPTERCGREQRGVALTDDGFDTVTYVPVARGWPDLEALGDGRFYLGQGRIDDARVVSVDADVPLTVDRTPAPVADGEVVVATTSTGRVRWLAVDGAAATAHAVALPPLGADQLVQQPGGRLVATQYYGEYGVAWSDDGGDTWSQQQLPGVPGMSTYQVLESLEPDTIAVAEGGDGATLFAFDRVHRSTDGGATWDVVDIPQVDGDQAYLGWAHVRDDGSLVSYMSSWSDARAHRPTAHPSGPYESEGTDWSRLRLVEPGLVGADTGDLLASQVQLLGVLPGDGSRIYVHDAGEAYVSADGGTTWEPVAAR